MNTPPLHPRDLATCPTPIWVLDPAGRLIWCTQSYADLYGLNVDDTVAAQKILTTRSGTHPLHAIVNGARHLFRTTLAPTLDGGQMGTAQNITREEELESAHKRSQTGTKELLEQLRAGIATFTADQKLEFYNTAFTQLWDVDAAFLSTRPKLGDIMERLRDQRRLPEQVDFRRYKQSWLDMFTNLLDPFEDMMHLPDGTALRMLVVPNPSGGLMFTFEDVTSRLALETSYNTLVAVQRETLDNLNEGVAVFGGDGRLKLWNPAFLKLWALNPEDLAGEPHITRLVERLRGSFSNDEWPRAREHLCAQVLNGSETDGRLYLLEDRLVSYVTVLLPDGGVLLSHSDITDSVRVENALRDKNAALEAAEQLKLDFLANVSYQLRTPLNAIMGFTEILGQEYFGSLNDKQKEYTAGTRAASERLLALIDDILDLSTIEAGQLKLDYDRVHIPELFGNLRDLTIDWARKSGLDIVLEIAPDVEMIEADPRRLKQIILNLIRNAIAFSPAGGVITLRAARDSDGFMNLSVIDQGMGIPVADQARIFDPFERGQNMETQGKAQGGAGLGLTLVKNIAELHGGRVVIDGQAGKGTCLTLHLPAHVQTGNPPQAL